MPSLAQKLLEADDRDLVLQKALSPEDWREICLIRSMLHSKRMETSSFRRYLTVGNRLVVGYTIEPIPDRSLYVDKTGVYRTIKGIMRKFLEKYEEDLVSIEFPLYYEPRDGALFDDERINGVEICFYYYK